MLGKYFKNKKREQRRREREKTAKGIAVGSLLGATLGSVAGILFAPKSGKETRKEINDKANEVSENVKNAVNEGIEATKEFQEKVVSDVKNVIDGYSKNEEDIIYEEDVEDIDDCGCENGECKCEDEKSDDTEDEENKVEE